MTDQEMIEGALRETAAMLEALHPQFIALASSRDLPQAEADAVRLIDTINQQTAVLQARQEK